MRYVLNMYFNYVIPNNTHYVGTPCILANHKNEKIYTVHK